MRLSDDSFTLVQADFDRVLSRTENLWRDLDGARVLVTGATGFFGSWLLGVALNASKQLGLDIQICALSRDPEKFIAYLPQIGESPRLKWVQGDVKSFDLPDGPWSHVIHAGVDASASAHAANPLGIFDSIIDGTRHCLSLNGITRFLNLSTGAVYGRLTSRDPAPNESYLGGPNPLETRNTYAEAKRAAENLCANMSSQFTTTSARCFAFVGPFQPMYSSFAIGNFIANAVEDKPIVITGDGSPLRSYLYAADLAEQLWTLLAYGNNGEAYNVGSPNPIDLASLAHLVQKLVGGPEVKVMKERDREAPQEAYVPDTGKIEGQFGFRSSTSLEEAIVKTADFYRSTHPVF